jgi:two-component system cell cycle sensor histidine kinase/response regulator CckA
MKESSGTKAELIAKISDLKQQIKKLKKSEAKRSQTEEALLESERKYRDLVENANSIIVRWSRDGKITFMNEFGQNFFGFNEKEIIGHHVIGTIVPEMESTGRDIRPLIDKISAYPKDFERIINENIRRNGERVWIAWTNKAMLDSQGRVLGVLSIGSDITDRKRAEEALKESEAKYRGLVDNSPEAIAIYVEGKIVFANNECLHLMAAATSAELIGKSVMQFVHPDYHALVIERMKKVANGKTILPLIEEKFVRLDGSNVEVEVKAMPIRFENKLAVQLIIRDITMRKQAEKEKRILEERLQHSDKMEAIGTFAGGIVHDFNNLLMGIQGYASLALLNLDPSNPNYERLKRIEQQVQSGADLTSQLLGFARGGRYEVKPTDMNDIIERTSSMFGRTKKEISIHIKYGKDLWNVEVDRGQMEQVFVNLYVNAWQAMPGGGNIYLETENVLLNDKMALPYSVKPGKYVKITIADTGTGMDEKTRERIFDPFFTTKTMGRGTGLGLATVYGIIKGHLGMINVYSEPGHGTSFTIYLPASEKDVIKEEAVTGEILMGTETILLVEDEKMIMDVNKELLESMGYRVYAVESGQEAIVVYKEKRNEIDLIILDMIMPGISGSETFDRLRKINPSVKVLLSSGYSLNGEAKHIMDRGCNGFLQKPYQIDKLSQKVREVLEI